MIQTLPTRVTCTLLDPVLEPLLATYDVEELVANEKALCLHLTKKVSSRTYVSKVYVGIHQENVRTLTLDTGLPNTPLLNLLIETRWCVDVGMCTSYRVVTQEGCYPFGVSTIVVHGV